LSYDPEIIGDARLFIGDLAVFKTDCSFGLGQASSEPVFFAFNLEPFH